MAESISFKAYLKQDGRDVEVRRFAIEGRAMSNFLNLRERIKKIFPVLQNDSFVIFWQDSDEDYITIGSDEELMEALVYYTTLPPPQPFKLYVHSQTASEQPRPGTATGDQTLHSGVVCDSCDGPVKGYRYKCIACPDFDLCATCEAAGHHSEHLMIRIPNPASQFGHGHPKFFRKFMGRTHKMHKRHCREDREAGPGRCPFGRRGGDEPPMEPFDFGVFSDFINELGTTGQRQSTANAQAGTQTEAGASAGTQTAAGASAGTQTPGAGAARHPPPPPPGAAYLNGIGQAIAAFLDPFGVDVTFDVRGKDTQEGAQPSTSNQSAQAFSAQQSPANPASQAASPTTVPTPTPTPQSTPVPTPAETPRATASPPAEQVDDWTLINRESPSRGEASAMDVDESQGVRPKTAPLYPELPKQTPTAPPQATETPMSDDERKRMKDNIEKLRTMGFDVESWVIQEILRRENFDINTVLEKIFSITGDAQQNK